LRELATPAPLEAISLVAFDEPMLKVLEEAVGVLVV
jgi:hypothetical protein